MRWSVGALDCKKKGVCGISIRHGGNSPKMSICMRDFHDRIWSDLIRRKIWWWCYMSDVNISIYVIKITNLLISFSPITRIPSKLIKFCLPRWQIYHQIRHQKSQIWLFRSNLIFFVWQNKLYDDIQWRSSSRDASIISRLLESQKVRVRSTSCSLPWRL